MVKDLPSEGCAPLLRRLAGVNLAAKELLSIFHVALISTLNTINGKRKKQTKVPRDPSIGGHEYAFGEVKKYTEKHVILEIEIIWLTLLGVQYVSSLKNVDSLILRTKARI